MTYLTIAWESLVGIALVVLVVLAAIANMLLVRLIGLTKARSRDGRATRVVVAFYNNRYVATHLQALAANDTSRPVISHSLKHAARITLRQIQRGKNSTVVCSIAIGDGYSQSVAPCIESQKIYAARHGFDYVLVSEKPARFDRPIPWMKISLIARLLREGYQRILFIDADAMITNGALPVDPYFESLEREGKSLLLTEDGKGANTGVMFVLNTPAALRLMDLIWRYDIALDHPTWEQNALNVLLNTYPEFGAPLEIDQVSRHFNSFPEERRQVIPTAEDQIWAPGDFICHFAGLRRPQLTDLIRHYAKITEATRPPAAAATAEIPVRPAAAV